jgi:3'-phosphoadenosine 5'-phosphosulfate sulfotransferase (PAPS reductase)/FAD synthetase
MFTKLEAEKNTNTNYLLNTIEVDFEEFIERIEEIVKDQQIEVEHFNRMRERAEQEGQKLAATHYAKKYMEIYDRCMNNIDILDLSDTMKDSVIFLMTGSVPSFVYVGRKKKQEHKRAKEDLKLIYF